MADFITNHTVTSTASDILPDGHAVDSCVIQALANDIVINIGADASATDGETIFADSSATFCNLGGRRVSAYAGSSTSVSLREEV